MGVNLLVLGNACVLLCIYWVMFVVFFGVQLLPEAFELTVSNTAHFYLNTYRCLKCYKKNECTTSKIADCVHSCWMITLQRSQELEIQFFYHILPQNQKLTMS